MAPHRPWNGDQSRDNGENGSCDFLRGAHLPKKTIETISITSSSSFVYRFFTHSPFPSSRSQLHALLYPIVSFSQSVLNIVELLSRIRKNSSWIFSIYFTLLLLYLGGIELIFPLDKIRCWFYNCQRSRSRVWIYPKITIHLDRRHCNICNTQHTSNTTRDRSLRNTRKLPKKRKTILFKSSVTSNFWGKGAHM